MTPASTIYNHLDNIRKRPGMYFGEPARLDLLMAFLTGVSLNKLGQEEPPFGDFKAWLAARIEDIPDSHNGVEFWLKEKFGTERGLEVYFNYLDEFRTTRIVLHSESKGPFVAKFTVGLEGERIPDSPERIVVGQFEESSIFFWGTETAGELEKHFHFCHSVAQARKQAQENWEIPSKSWRKLNAKNQIVKSVPYAYVQNQDGLIALLERIRKRPGMYVNLERDPLVAIETMLSGYECALETHGIHDSGQGFSRALNNYILYRFRWSTSCGWADAIRSHLKAEENELSRFFSMLDELVEVKNELEVQDYDELAGLLDEAYMDNADTSRRSKNRLLEELFELI